MLESLHRKRFQIHLSTAIVMMFVAGGIIWINAKPKEYQLIYSMTDGVYNTPDKDGAYMTSNRYFGWPFTFVITIDHLVLANGNWKHDGDDWTIHDTCNNSLLAIDGLVAIVILLTFWFMCEWPIRRRAARKGE
jgi:hypothetical protein